MGSILHLHDAHDRVQQLIPWYVNGTLDESESALVRSHSNECEECRHEIMQEQKLRQELARFPDDCDSGWVSLEQKVLDHPPRRPNTLSQALGKPIALGWALVGQAAVAASVAIGFLLLSSTDSNEGYRLLSANDAEAPGNLIVLFAPETREADFRRAIDDVGARIVGGPTQSGAYVLAVATGARERAVARLRSSGTVILAEPISSEPYP